MTWAKVALKDVARIVGGATPKTTEPDLWDGDIFWATPKDLSNLSGPFIASTPRTISAKGLASCSSELLPPNSVLFSSRAPIGHVAINTVPMATNQGFKSMIPGPQLDPNFLYWWLNANRTALQDMGVGATFKEVSKAIVERVEIPLPPLEEQKRIAAILDQADALRRLRARALDRLNALGQAIFHEMFGDPVANTKGLALVRLGDICDVRDGTHDSPKYVEAGFPLLTSKNFSGGSVDFDGAKMISKVDFDKINQRSKVDQGDIVMPMIGTIGSPVIIDFDPNFAIKNVALIKFTKAGVRNEFIHALLSGNYLERAVDKQGKGGTQKFLSLSDIRGLLVPLPSEELQVDFGVAVRSLRLNTAVSRNALVMAETLFTSLQHRAFRGEL